MSTPGAARRQQDDGSPVLTPDEICARADATLARLWRKLEDLTAQDAAPALLTELLGAGLHLEEFRQELARFAAAAGTRDALIEMGRALERQAQAAAQASRPARSRHARSRRPYLRPVIAASVAAVTVAGGAGIAVHDEAAEQPAVSAPLRPAILRAAAFPPGRAVPVPSPSPSAPRRALDVKAATPAPSPSPSAPAVTVSPPPPLPPAPPQPGLLVSARDLELTGPSGTFTLAATTDGAVDWSVSTDIPGASLSVVQGVLDSAQEPVTITVVDPLGESGTIFIRYGNRGIATIWVTSSLGAPAVP